jgi:DNA-binding beta-propeller fold protein YncE
MKLPIGLITAILGIGLCLFSGPPSSAQDLNLSFTLEQVVYQPQRIAVSQDDRIAVSEPRRNLVRMLDEEGRLLNDYFIVQDPLAVGFDNEGNVLIGGRTSVNAYDVSGALLYSLGIGSGEFGKPNDIAVAPDGRIYVTDCGEDRVKVYGSTGEALFSFGSTGSGAGEFNFPTGIAFDPIGDEVYIADQGNARVQVFNSNGDFLRAFGEFTYQESGEWVFEGTFTRIQGLAVDALRRVYVADAYQNNVQILTAEGDFLAFLAQDEGGSQYFSLPMDVAVSGDLLSIASTADSKVQGFSIDDLTDVSGILTAPAPTAFALDQNYPNPFNPETSIQFYLSRPGWVELSVWDLLGRRVARLANAAYSAGAYEVHWDGKTSGGEFASSGLYLCTFRVKDNSGTILFHQNRKMLLMK